MKVLTMNMVKIEILFFLSLFFITCSDGSTKSETNLPENPISGTYFLHGTKVNLKYQFPWPSWGGEIIILETDTTQIAMTVKVGLPEEKQDTVRFTGLEGLNAGEYQSVNRNCSHPSCFGDAELKNGELFFDLSAPYGFYIGRGTLEDGKLILQTHFEYREIGIDYYLKGTRIDE